MAGLQQLRCFLVFCGAILLSKSGVLGGGLRLAQGHSSRQAHKALLAEHRVHFPGSNVSLQLVQPRHCVARHGSGGSPRQVGPGHSPRRDTSSARVDVVLAVCAKLQEEFLRQLRCTAGGAQARYFVYHLCQLPGPPEGLESLRQIQGCTASARTDVRSAEAAVLEHILEHREALSAATVFAATSAVPAANDLLEAVAKAAEDVGGTNFRMFAANASLRPRVLPGGSCRLIQRYSCVEACSTAGLSAMSLWPSHQVFFAASAERLRSLDVHEYQWLRSRHHLVAGMWPFLLGCPSAVDSAEGEPSSCGPGWKFGSGSDRSKPTELALATKEMHPEKLRVLPQECVLRDLSLPPPSMTPPAHHQQHHHHQQQHRGPRVGIVLVHCDENLSKLRGLQCNAEDPEAVLYIFSKCGMAEETAREQLGDAAWGCVRSFRSVPATLETELAWTKHHREYLEFIISRYYSLEPMTLFIKANFHRRRLDLAEMVRDALDNEWAFKAYGGPKRAVDLTSFPESGNSEVWRREICAMYRRYACVDACAPEKDLAAVGVPVPLYNTRSMWVASSARIRSLRVTEYQWWREYISNAPQEEGVTRRYMLERLWQVLLGCPEEHHTAAIMGCKHTQAHPRGQASAPPPELLLAGSSTGVVSPGAAAAVPAQPLVHWPQPRREDFIPERPYPNFLALADRGAPAESPGSTTAVREQAGRVPAAADRRITFVVSLDDGARAGEKRAEVVRATAVAAARFHVNCRFVLLAEEEGAAETSKLLSPEFWSGRMEVHVRPQAAARALRPSFLGWWQQLPHSSSNGRMDLELWFLQKIAADPLEMDRHGHLVMTDARSIIVAPLWDAFDAEAAEAGSNMPPEGVGSAAQQPFSVAVVYAPPSPADPIGNRSSSEAAERTTGDPPPADPAAPFVPSGGASRTGEKGMILGGTWLVRRGGAPGAVRLLEAVASVRRGGSPSSSRGMLQVSQAEGGGDDEEEAMLDSQAWSEVITGCTTAAGRPVDLSSNSSGGGGGISDGGERQEEAEEAPEGAAWSSEVIAATCPLGAAPRAASEGPELPPVAVRMRPCALWQAAVGGPRVEACPVLSSKARAIEFARHEVNSHLTAVLRIKDKSTGLTTLKTSVLQLLKFHGKELSPRLRGHYLSLLNSTEMRRVWMPPEKRGLPTIGPVPKRRHGNNDTNSSSSGLPGSAADADAEATRQLPVADGGARTRMFPPFSGGEAGIL